METKVKSESTEQVNEQVKAKVKNLVSMLVAREQKYLYKWQTEMPKIPAKEAKKLRQKIRRKLENFYFQICLQKNAETKKASIQEFMAFYKANYILNDFSIQSLTETHDQSKKESYIELLKVVKESLKK